MSLRCTVFIATSLDGFIARPDGRLDWLDAANATVPEGTDLGYPALMRSIDVLIMGRGTFETVLGFDAWPYGDKRVIVLSSGPLSFGPRVPPTVRSSHASTSHVEARTR